MNRERMENGFDWLHAGRVGGWVGEEWVDGLNETGRWVGGWVGWWVVYLAGLAQSSEGDGLLDAVQVQLLRHVGLDEAWESGWGRGGWVGGLDNQVGG